MHQPFDHALALVLILLFPVRAAFFGFRKLQRCDPSRLPEMRRRVYRDAILLQWGLVLALFAFWLYRHRHWTALGLDPRLTWGLIGLMVGSAGIALLVLRQRRLAARDDAMLEQLRSRMSHLEVMLPHTRAEFDRFAALAITAGICEEILYRGYLLWYFSMWMGVIPAAALSVAIFGVGHAYQGLRGVFQTALVGGFLMAAYLVSGSIYLPMVLHGLMDLHSGDLMLRVYQREAERASQAERMRAAPEPEAIPLTPEAAE